ncbi:ribosome small subunit-dependent GTPase A [Paramicrobacterium agarici]|uniref:Small ribosomal subunit biogenesis GTPase RsgA n=1 Tax=Paramicrobacterium agarici TaxID=630514 RepID=A0A2A9DY60_9MICO|nr:ribosome small subunit-dependent GTPase A [Microbacterium agarici]PFG30869.1 ribosome biogenesis GTPase [Microbacterium agarici]TQO23936.1 ribosome biogenesis GTPase [Microbacterium agarici]
MSWWNGDDETDEPLFDESDVRVRPSRRGSRPRTKTRPAHKDAVTGTVLGVDRGRYTVLLDEDQPTEREVTSSRASELRRQPIVNGDRVDVVGDLSGQPGTLARIVRIKDRSTLLRRSADDTDDVERIIVANADQMLIVVAAANPEPRARLVDRYLVAAFDAGITPLMVITKTDLADPAEFRSLFAELPLTVFTSRTDDMPLDQIAGALVGHTTVFVGHSGVGKSTLVNALVPEANRSTGHVNQVTGRGRHTSSSAVSYRVARDGSSGWIIDTPGVRSFGLGHVDTDNILEAFPDLSEVAENCPRGCTHLPDAPDCALNEAARDGDLDEVALQRLDSLQRLLTTFTG